MCESESECEYQYECLMDMREGEQMLVYRARKGLVYTVYSTSARSYVKKGSKRDLLQLQRPAHIQYSIFYSYEYLPCSWQTQNWCSH